MSWPLLDRTAGSEKRMQICRAGDLLLLIGHAHTYNLCGTELSITYVTTGVEVRVCRVNDSITVDRGNVSLNNLQLQQVNKCTSNMLVRDPEQDLQLCMYQHLVILPFSSKTWAINNIKKQNLCTDVC